VIGRVQLTPSPPLTPLSEIDTGQRPNTPASKRSEGFDVLRVPTVPATLEKAGAPVGVDDPRATRLRRLRAGAPVRYLGRAGLQTLSNASGRARRANPSIPRAKPLFPPHRALSAPLASAQTRSGYVTILMRKSVKKAARRKLEDEEEGRDISTLIDELLTNWLSKANKIPVEKRIKNMLY
jgi:hypothetical protein